jgi:hypothetical protein
VTDAASLLILELRDRVIELQAQLAITQEDLIEMARDAGVAQAEINSLCAQVADLRADRDAWRALAKRLSSPAGCS